MFQQKSLPWLLPAAGGELAPLFSTHPLNAFCSLQTPLSELLYANVSALISLQRLVACMYPVLVMLAGVHFEAGRMSIVVVGPLALALLCVITHLSANLPVCLRRRVGRLRSNSVTRPWVQTPAWTLSSSLLT